MISDPYNLNRLVTTPGMAIDNPARTRYVIMNNDLTGVTPRLIPALALLIVLPSFGISRYEPPTLTIYGETYVSNCKPWQIAEIRKTLAQSGADRPVELKAAVEVLLCASPTDRSRAFVRKLLPKAVRKATQATGDEDTSELVPRNAALVDEMFAEGFARDVTLTTETDKVTLQYFANEACVKSRTLILVKNRWAIAKIGEACD